MSLVDAFERLLAQHGPQHWWPGDTPFEIMVGAILTQNTAWSNVEQAIANLKAARKLSPRAIAGMSAAELGSLIRPSGYFNVKAKRLQTFCAWLIHNGGMARVAQRETVQLRHDLLAVHGIGNETADDMLLYAFARPVFVVDAYTRRLLGRLGFVAGDEPYDALRTQIETSLGREATGFDTVALFNEYHALIVAHAKHICRPKPRCRDCSLRRGCPSRGRFAAMERDNVARSTVV